jgi:hypothetical protein
MTFGNEGDDWIEHGTGRRRAGDNFDTLGRDASSATTSSSATVADRMLGEGGDDIMIGMGGQVDRYMGGSGFDWAIFKHPTQGAYADMTLRLSNTATILPLRRGRDADAVLHSVEGMSGSAFADVLIGDEPMRSRDRRCPAHRQRDDQLRPDRRDAGVRGQHVRSSTSFGSGNIILGGDGSDMLQGQRRRRPDRRRPVAGRVHQRARQPRRHGRRDRHADTMTELVDEVFSGTINPGSWSIVRELVQATAPATSTPPCSAAT